MCILAGRSGRDPLREILALDELHHEGVGTVGLFQAVDDRDVRMVQGRESLGFACETCKPFGVARKRVRQDLDRDVAIQFCVPRAKHFSHAAGTECSDDFVRAESRAGGESHRRCRGS
jgi:hypothetical protein